MLSPAMKMVLGSQFLCDVRQAGYEIHKFDLAGLPDVVFRLLRELPNFTPRLYNNRSA